MHTPITTQRALHGIDTLNEIEPRILSNVPILPHKDTSPLEASNNMINSATGTPYFHFRVHQFVSKADRARRREIRRKAIHTERSELLIAIGNGWASRLPPVSPPLPST